MSVHTSGGQRSASAVAPQAPSSVSCESVSLTAWSLSNRLDWLASEHHEIVSASQTLGLQVYSHIWYFKCGFFRFKLSTLPAEPSAVLNFIP